MVGIAPNKVRAQGLLQQLVDAPGFRPLVLDMDGDGIELIAPENGILFDISDDGAAEKIGWVAPDDGFLVLDRNGNGVIDQLSELFCAGPFGGFYELGVEEATTGDDSGDISDDDVSLFGQLRIWKDVNSDGLSQAAELSTLTDNGIEEIEVHYSPAVEDNRWKQGNYLNVTSDVFTYIGEYFGPITQVDFSVAGTADFITGEGIYTGGDADLLALPQSRGFGSLPSWQEAMEGNPALRGMMEDFAARTDYMGIDGAVEAILFEWAGISDFEPGLNDRDPFHPRSIRFMEELLGVDYPSDYAISSERHVVMHAWDLVFNDFKALLLVQGPLEDLFPHAQYDFATDELSLNDTLPAILARVEASALAGDVDFLFDLRNILLLNSDELHVTENDINQTSATLLAQAWGNAELVNPLMAAFEAGRVITGEAETLWDFIGLTYVLEGTSLNDLIRGGDGDDKLDGLDGIDLLYGGDGDDMIANGVNYEFNHLVRPSFYDTVFGGDGDDRLILSGRDLWADGGEGDDTFLADRSSISEQQRSGSTLEGGAGNDLFIGNGGYVTIMGGDGNDIVQRSATSASDSFNNSHIDLGDGDDLYEQSGHGNRVYGGAGDDAITSYGAGHFYGGEGDDRLDGSEYDDVLIGDGGNDTLAGYNGDNLYAGGSGNDHIIIFARAGATDTIIDFDPLHDRLDFRDTPIRMFQELDIANIDGDTVITLPNGQTVILESLPSHALINADIVFSAPNVINGTSGMDTLTGTSGSDVINGFGEADTLIGGEGYDTLAGGWGRDMLHGGEGADMLYGGFDSAYASYAEDTAGISIDLGDAGPQSGGEAEGDVLDNIRGVIGGFGNDLIIGAEGNHTLMGGAGDDMLDGGGQADLLTGGEGADIFRFSFAEESRLPRDSDRITDFEDGADRFDLSGLGFHHITSDAVTEAGELRVEHHDGITYVLSDQVDFGFRLNGDFSGQLTDADFILA